MGTAGSVPASQLQKGGLKMLKLREIRLSKGISVAELSRTSGVSKRTIEDLEARGDCRISTARILCDALGVTLDDAWPSEIKE